MLYREGRVDGKLVSFPLSATIMRDMNYDHLRTWKFEKVVDLNYIVGGNPGGIPVVLIHGLTSAHSTWEQLMAHEHFVEKYRYIAIDLRGHGFSYSEHLFDFLETGKFSPQRFHPTLMALDIARVMNQEGFKSAHIVGHSFGSRPAIELARSFPEMVSSLVFEDIGVEIKEEIPLEKVLEEAKRYTYIKPFYDETEKDAFMRDVVGQYYGINLQKKADVDNFLKEYVGWKIYDFADGYLLRCHPSVIELFNFFSGSINWTDPLEKALEHGITVKFILGELGNGKKGEEFYMNQISDFYQDQVSLEIIKGAGHSVHREKTEQFFVAFDDFVSDVELIASNR